jgi:Cu2+-exporting ATPase
MTHEHHHGDERQEHLEKAAGVTGPEPGHDQHASTGTAARPRGQPSAATGHGAHPPMAGGRMDHAAHAKGGAHDRDEGHSVAMFRDKFWLSLALTIPVVLLSHDIQE